MSRRLAGDAAVVLSGQLSTAALTGALTLYLVRTLGPGDFGRFSLALAIGTLALLAADFGVAQAGSRFVAERRGNRAEVAAVIAAALRVKLLCSAVVATALAALAGPIAEVYGVTGLAWPLRGMALAMFAQSLFTLLTYGLNGQRRFGHTLGLTIAESAVEVGASVALVAAGAGATGATLGRAAGYGTGAVLALAVVLRLVGRGALPRRGDPGLARDLLRYAGALFLANAAYTLFEQLDVLLVGAYLGAASAGAFQAPLRLTTFLHYPSLALASAAGPRIARGTDGDGWTAASALRAVLLLQAALTVPVAVWGGPLAHALLGDSYAASADVLRALAPYVFLSGFAAFYSLAANYAGEARRRVPVGIAAILVNLAIDVMLIPRIGVVGGAFGSDVGMAVYVAGHLHVLRGRAGFSLRPLAATAGRALVAAAAAAGVLLALGTGDLSPAAWAAGALCAPAAFLAVLVATGEVSRSELRGLAGRAKMRS